LPRPRLLEGAPDVLVLLAGPGAGKTALARVWADALKLPLILATADAQPQTPAETGAVVLFDEPTPAMVSAWLATPRPGLRTVIASRQPLNLPLARRIARGEVRVLEGSELFFTPDEAAEAWPLALEAGGDEALRAALVEEELLSALPEAVLALARALAELEAPPASLAERWPEEMAWLHRWGLLDRTRGWLPLARTQLLKRPATELRLEVARAVAAADPVGAIQLLLAAGEPAEAEAVLESAGRDRLRRGAANQLAALLDAFTPQTSRRHLLEGAWLISRGDLPGAEARLRQAADAYLAAGDRPHAFEALGDLLHLYWTREDLDAFKRIAAEAAPLEADATLAEKSEFQLNLGCHDFGAGNEAEARRRFLAVLDVPHFGQAQLASVQQFAAINLGILEMEAGHFDQAVPHFERVLELAAAFQLRPSVPRGARLYLAGMALQLGDRVRAEELLAALTADPFPAEDAYRRAEFQTLEGDYHLLTGDHAGAEACYRGALATFAGIQMETCADAGAATMRLAVIHRRRGEPEAALRLLERALPLVTPWPRYETAVRLETAVTQAMLGHPAAAAGELARAEALLAETPAAHMRAGSALIRAALAAKAGRPDAPALARTAAEAVRAGPYYYAVIARRELAPDLWALFARAGEGALLQKLEALFPTAAAGIRGEVQAPAALPEQAPAALDLKFFGGFEVRLGGEPVTAWPRKKARLLLALLALNPAGFSREELADRLFPDLDFEKGLHQLDIHVSALRQALEPGLGRRQRSRYFESRERQLKLVRDGVSLDVEDFENACKEARRGDTSAYRKAAALYTGDLLPEPLMLDAFDLERHRLQGEARTALATLAEAAFAEGHYEEARGLAERQLALDATDETAQRLLLRLAGQFGQRDQLKTRYELLVKTLKHELDAEPDAETTRLYQQLLKSV
jgi:DNA-binding SARP family transcriptional activator